MWFNIPVKQFMLEAETGREGQIPMGGSGEGVCKHSAGENWASDIGRLVIWDRNGPHHVCTNHTLCNSSNRKAAVRLFPFPAVFRRGS